MLYSIDAARARVRNLDGRRVFYLAPGDHLSPSAREWLAHERIEILPPSDQVEYTTLFGAVLTEKPEHMTHLHGNTLVFKDHPRIAFRGFLDMLQAEVLLLVAEGCKLDEVLALLRTIMRCDVLNEPLTDFKLGGLDEMQLRERSHHPERFYGISHFMPSEEDTPQLLRLNRLRTLARQAELAAYRAYRDENGACTREDILKAMNRLSSYLYVEMIRLKAELRK